MTGDPAVEEVTVRGLALVLTRDLGLAESVTAHVMAEGPMPLADRLAAVRREAASSAAPAGEGRDHAAFWNDPPEVRAATWLIGTGIPPSEVAVGLGMSQAGLRELLGLPAVLTTVPEAGICPSPDRLAAYSSGDLPPGEAAAIGDHLALCVDCRRQVDRFEEIADEVARMPPPPPPPPPEGALSWEPSKTAAGPAIRVVRQRGPAGAAAALSQRRRRRRRGALLVGLPAVILV
ncbi:MAG: hypothetical protein ACR2NJ_01820, partial [Acidimicrobiales bacterium]